MIGVYRNGEWLVATDTEVEDTWGDDEAENEVLARLGWTLFARFGKSYGTLLQVHNRSRPSMSRAEYRLSLSTTETFTSAYAWTLPDLMAVLKEWLPVVKTAREIERDDS